MYSQDGYCVGGVGESSSGWNFRGMDYIDVVSPGKGYRSSGNAYDFSMGREINGETCRFQEEDEIDPRIREFWFLERVYGGSENLPPNIYLVDLGPCSACYTIVPPANSGRGFNTFQLALNGEPPGSASFSPPSDQGGGDQGSKNVEDEPRSPIRDLHFGDVGEGGVLGGLPGANDPSHMSYDWLIPDYGKKEGASFLFIHLSNNFLTRGKVLTVCFRYYCVNGGCTCKPGLTYKT